MKLKKLTMLITLIIATLCSAFSLVVKADADKTALTAAYNQVLAIIDTQDGSPVGDPYYEVDSYQAFTDAITALGGTAGIQAVIDDALALQQDVDDLTADINLAIDGLVLHDTYYAILAYWSQAKTADINAYTSDSQSAYHNELDRIMDILDDPTAGETVVQGLTAEIDAASDLLVLRGDKTEVLSKKAEIETIYGTTGEDYIPSTFEEFQNAYDQIDTVLAADIGMTLQQLIDDIDALVSEVSQAETRLDEVLEKLVLRPDKQDLIDEYDVAAAVDGDLYTSSSFATFTSGLTSILAVINDVEAREADVTQAQDDLADLYSLLVLKGDTTDLQTEFDNASTMDLETYTPNSVALFEDELDRIEIILLSDDQDQTDIDNALSDLTDAYDLLVLQAEKEDLVLLNSLLIDAYYRDINLYTQSSHEAFVEACNDFGGYLYANQVIADLNVSQTIVDNLTADISSALSLLIELADNDSLLDMYYDLKTRDLSTYTMSSKIEYNVELNRLYNIIISPDLDTNLANQVLQELTDALNLLVEMADFEELQDAYDSSLIYRAADYTSSSYQALEDARVEALSVLSDTNSTQAEINDTIILIETAVENLELKLETIYIVEGDTLDVNQFITLGQSSINRYEVENAEVITVDDQGIVTALVYGETNVKVHLSNGAVEIIDIFVKAKPSTAVYVMTFTLPVISVGFAAGAMYIRKETWINLFNMVKNVFKKKK